MADRLYILSNLELLEQRGLPVLDPGAPIFLRPEPTNHFGRFYDTQTLMSRVILPARAAGLTASVGDVRFDGRCCQVGTDLALLLEQPREPGSQELPISDRLDRTLNPGSRFALYASKLELEPTSLIVARGERQTLDLHVTNASSQGWELRGKEGGVPGAVRVGVRWRSRDGVLLSDKERIGFDQPVAPGESACLPLVIDTRKAPLDRPGEYLAEITLVHEDVTWFDHAGDRSLQIEVSIR